MKKCKGCGAVLQTEYPERNGYVKDISQDYCQRCFRLTHYDDVTHFKADHLNNSYIKEIYEKYPDALFVVIIDILDVFCLSHDDLLTYFKDKDVMLVINKTDILPDNIRDEKMEMIFTKQLKELRRSYPHIKAAIMTNRYESYFNDRFNEILREMNYCSIVFAGRANAGKSTLINKLLQEDILTTSVYPGTTLNETQISYHDYTFIDTPGLSDPENYTTYLDLKSNKKLKIAKAMRPQIFQFNSPQSYFFEGLLRVDIEPERTGSIIFYVANEFKIHRSSLMKADRYYENNMRDFTLKAPLTEHGTYEVKGKQLFIIKGMGMFKVTGKCRIKIHIHPDVKVYLSEVQI